MELTTLLRMEWIEWRVREVHCLDRDEEKRGGVGESVGSRIEIVKRRE